MGGCQHIWLEVTSTNEPALAFYRALGYEEQGRSEGNEVKREGNGFSMVDVQRCVLRKTL